jgi:methyltransferase-like protein 6
VTAVGQGCPATLLEVGCGTGNTVFPLLAANADLFVHCCDFAASAVELVKSNSEFNQERCHAFQADVTEERCFSSIESEPPLHVARSCSRASSR